LPLAGLLVAGLSPGRWGRRQAGGGRSREWGRRRWGRRSRRWRRGHRWGRHGPWWRRGARPHQPFPATAWRRALGIQRRVPTLAPPPTTRPLTAMLAVILVADHRILEQGRFGSSLKYL